MLFDLPSCLPYWWAQHTGKHSAPINVNGDHGESSPPRSNLWCSLKSCFLTKVSLSADTWRVVFWEWGVSGACSMQSNVPVLLEYGADLLALARDAGVGRAEEEWQRAEKRLCLCCPCYLLLPPPAVFAQQLHTCTPHPILASGLPLQKCHGNKLQWGEGSFCAHSVPSSLSRSLSLPVLTVRSLGQGLCAPCVSAEIGLIRECSGFALP